MAVTVTVGPPVISINHGSTFLVSEFDGSITDASDQGLYSRTRDTSAATSSISTASRGLCSIPGLSPIMPREPTS